MRLSCWCNIPTDPPLAHPSPLTSAQLREGRKGDKRVLWPKGLVKEATTGNRTLSRHGCLPWPHRHQEPILTGERQLRGSRERARLAASRRKVISQGVLLTYALQGSLRSARLPPQPYNYYYNVIVRTWCFLHSRGTSRTTTRSFWNIR
ncbi:hypothetical protein ElyMa_004694400 [Elysia marginata]|uniref:DUF5641 domain-containing protein n=1 Tax=Elysia marginata TaxID=1093978 RepID=A0AAV4IA65_9GAST|nr:hypothetical protein ElyMa_004694400 [Elysia marginata]